VLTSVCSLRQRRQRSDAQHTRLVEPLVISKQPIGTTLQRLDLKHGARFEARASDARRRTAVHSHRKDTRITNRRETRKVGTIQYMEDLKERRRKLVEKRQELGC
jgi:hypothetical protein